MLTWLQKILGGAGDRDGDDAGIPIDLAALPGAFTFGEGLPRPHWPVIRTAADALCERYGKHRVW